MAELDREPAGRRLKVRQQLSTDSMKVLPVIIVILVTFHSTISQYNDLKRSSIYNNYVDDHCEGHFQVSSAKALILITIFLTRWRPTPSSGPRTASTWAAASSTRRR